MKNLIILVLVFTINCIDRIAPCNAGKICTYSLMFRAFSCKAIAFYISGLSGSQVVLQ